MEARAHKRLVICCDGTWNRPDRVPVTNIEKIARTVGSDLQDTDGVQQLVLYLSGVGTRGYLLDRILGGAFGYGLFANIRAAYRFLALNFDDGDEIFVFGFSRGAYTARSLVGMMARVGLLTRRALVEDKLAEAEARYRSRTAGATGFTDSPQDFKRKYCHPETPVALLGVFDTVGALGVPGAVLGAHQFHDTRLDDIVTCARQALALDERILELEPCLWEADEEHRRRDEASGRVEQVWFTGVHVDVGGGYAESGLSDTTLLWVVTEAKRRGLVFDDGLLEVYVGSGQPAVLHDDLTWWARLVNLVSRVRLHLRHRAERYLHGWRRLDPPPAPPTNQQAVAVSIASAAVDRYRHDPDYHHPNVVEFDALTDGFRGRVTEVVALPSADGQIES
jgi:uncharacterized protein (DUF2235 family)